MSFSVLLSVYNKEDPKYLEKALDSIYKAQACKPSEIILIKDGELTYALNETIVKKVKEIKVLKVFGYKKNKGLGYALNFGLKKCSNEFVFRMDCDDISHPLRFKKQLKFLKKKGIAIVGTQIEEFNFYPGDLKRYRKVPITSFEINKKKTFKNPFNHMTVGFKKSVVESVGGYKEVNNYEDYFLWLRVLKNHSGYNINIPLVYARVGNDMIGRRYGYSIFINEIKFQNLIFKKKLITKIHYYLNLIMRAMPRLLPKPFISFLYKSFLRKNN